MMNFQRLPPLTEQETANMSAQKLNQGLTLVGKTLASALEWTGQFTKIQNKHYEELKAREKQLEGKNPKKPTSFTQKIRKGFSRFTQKTCGLCTIQKASQSFIQMCSCQHTFCYSCLNTYAISKIQDSERVVCPHLNCEQQMKLSSTVYKYLPEKIKLKYLEMNLKDKAKRNSLEGKCLRCLEKQHQGQCRVVFNAVTIEKAFQFRKCRMCATEVGMTEGKRRVNCPKCHHTFCYICRQDWLQRGQHQCTEQPKIHNIEQQVQQQTCCSSYCKCSCCQQQTCTCCSNLQLNCGHNCQQCMNSCCYCKDCDFFICSGNVVCFFFRNLLTLFFLMFYLLMLAPLSIFFIIWIVGGIATGATCFTCELIQQCDGIKKIFAIVFCPFVMLFGIFIGLKQTGKGFFNILSEYCDFCSSGICEMWVNCSPQSCCV